MFTLLLSPAIRLMNRMNYLYKFSLINLLFLIPLLGLAYLQLNEIAESRQMTRTGQLGINSLGQAIKQVELASELRDLAVIQGSGVELENERAGLKQEYLQGLEQLQQRLGTGASTTLMQQMDKLRQMVQEKNHVGAADSAFLFVKNNSLVLESWILVHRLSYETGVYQDRDPNNFILMKIALDSLESLLENQGQKRAFSAQVMKSGMLNSNLMDIMNQVMDSLLEDQTRLESSLRPIFATQGQFGSELVALANQLSDRLKQGTERFDNTLLVEEDLNHDWREYYQQDSATSRAAYALIYGALEYVADRLEARDQAENGYFIGLLSSIILIFLVTNYLMLAFNFSVRNSIQAILDTADGVADGDMTCRVQISNTDELGTLAQRFNQMTERMHQLLSEVTTTVAAVVSQAGQVGGIAQQSSEAVETQRRETDMVATAINQMVVSVQEVADRTQIASQESEEVDQQAVQGQRLVSNTLADIGQLSQDMDKAMQVIHLLVKDSDSITQVLDVIKGVAEQTNLLALNAAIEAARAGEQGRGFAVVADEVRTLAKRTQDATAEIEDMINRLQSGVSDAVQAMEVSHEKVGQTVTNSAEVGQTLEHISTAISRIVEFNTQIAATGEQQTMVANEIERNVQSISDVGSQTADGARGTAEACQQMTLQAERLQTMVASFRV